MSQLVTQIGLINPKTPTNVGSIIRAAGCYQADAIFYTGERYARAAQYQTDTKLTEEKLPVTKVDCLSECMTDDVKVVCVDFAQGATPLPEFVHPEKALYVFGPEDGSIDQQTVDRADAVVYIPTVGCMNLAATVNVLLYDRLAKSNRAAGSEALIKSSKDRNNKIKVRG